jgi:hypothetical protein
VIFIHKLWILIGKIVFWYILLGFASGITFIGIVMIAYLADTILIFIIDFSFFNYIDILLNNLEFNQVEKVLLFIPLILFFIRPHLADWSKDDPDKKDYSIYNPFSDWGDIIYQERHKDFYNKYYTNDYIKWKKTEDKKKNKKRKK